MTRPIEIGGTVPAKDGIGPLAYFRTVLRLIRNPPAFFSGLPPNHGSVRPIAFLLISGAIYALACLLFMGRPQTALEVLAQIAWAVVPPIPLAVSGHLAVWAIAEHAVRFQRLLAVHAYAGGLTLLLAWAPYMQWPAETFRWIMVSLGLVRACGLKKFQALFVVLVSALVTWLLFRSLASVTGLLRGLF